MKISLFAIIPISIAVAFCAGEWRAGNIMDNIAKEHKQAPLPKPTRVDPAITETFNVFKQSHGSLIDCIKEARQITSVLGDLLVEHVSFGTCQSEHDFKYASIDYDKSLTELSKFKEYLMDKCPINE